MSARPLRPLLSLLLALAAQGGDLKIHVINVGWGSSVLVEGPTGTRALLEAGHTNRAQNVVNYLQNVAHVPSGGISYVVLGHNHTDHGGGLNAVWSAGFIASSPHCYYDGSTNNASLVSGWFSGLGRMPDVAAPSLVPLIDLGGGAQIYCIAARGQNLASGSAPSQSSDENDNSMGLVIKYGNFTYLWTSDMGGFELDGCSGRSSAQADLETPMIQAAIAAGALAQGGVDVLEVGHHGSESSTNPDYVKAAHPSVAIISTGRGQSSGWDLPRVAVVDNVLLGACGFSPSPLVLQTEDGDRNDQGKRSTSGYAVGNIVVDSDGTQFWVSANGDPSTVNIADSSTVALERSNAGLVNTADPRGRAFAVHGGTSGGNTVTTTITTPASNVTVASGASQAFSGSATDSSATATLSYAWSFGDGATATGASTSHTYTNTGTSSVAYTATLTATDSTGAKGSASRTVTDSPVGKNTDTASITTTSANLTLATGTTQAFAGSATDSASGATFTYGWAFGDGGNATGASASHLFTNSGTAPVTDTVVFTATDQTGASASATRLVTVNPVATSSAFNEVEPNDSQATANVVPDAATSIVGYFPSTSDNDDYFQVTLLAGHTLTVDMTGPTASSQDYDLYLYSSSGTQLASSTNSGTTEHLSYKNTNTTASKTLCIRVNRYASYSRVTPYTLALSR